MSIKTRFFIYLFTFYVLAGGLVVAFLAERVWLLVLAEAGLALLLIFGIRLIHQIFGPLEVLAETTQMLQENDFTTRVRPMGRDEMDRLIDIYNRMAERLRRERVANREQAHFLNSVLEVSPAGIMTFDFEGRIATVNPSLARMFQLEAERMIGRSLKDLGTPLASALAEVEPDEAKVIPFSGRRRMKCTRAHFLDRGHYRDFIIIDELTEELRRTEKTAYDKLIRIMTHEINNSVGAANSLLHSCLQYRDQIREEDREDFETALNVVISRTEHLNSFMADYASVARLPPPHKAPTDAPALVRRVVRLLGPQLEARNIELHEVMESAPPVIALDAQQMEQVLLNILKNAVEAIGNEGTVTVRWLQEEGRPVLVVEDSGGGISPEVMSSLFTPFYTTKREGQGIGLTLISEILNQHGFDYSLESPEGLPTRFTIRF
ncbi:MAG: ATP-binding protein [Acidobacteriota bacterium]|nr:ATP-binding protein [Acidobacteriota bacterium]